MLSQTGQVCVDLSKAMLRPSVSSMVVAPQQLVCRTAMAPGCTGSSPGCGWNIGSSVISEGEMVVNMRVRYGHFVTMSRACSAGAWMRSWKSAANSFAFHFVWSIWSW